MNPTTEKRLGNLLPKPYARNSWLTVPDLPTDTEVPTFVEETIRELRREWCLLCNDHNDDSNNNRNRSDNNTETLGSTIIKSYEFDYQIPPRDFPPSVNHQSILSDRIHSTHLDTQCYKVSCQSLSLQLPHVEPIFCHMHLVDISTGTRISETLHFETSSSEEVGGMFYILPSHRIHNVHLVVQLSKVLQGDIDAASSPYCHPERYCNSEVEKQKLQDRAAEFCARLGKYQQALAWGTMPLLSSDTVSSSSSFSLYRQRGSVNDEQRMAAIQDVLRGTLKEKVIPASIKFVVESVSTETMKTLDDDLKHPFSTTALRKGVRECLPFVTVREANIYGIGATGPVATSYVNTLFIYPNELERFQHRNIAIKVELMANDDDDVEDGEYKPLCAMYQNTTGLATEVFSQVTYHQKSPQFGDEIKIQLPIVLNHSHHVRFTFYHVHCKTSLKDGAAQELEIGRALLPLFQEVPGGNVIPDGSYVLPVVTDDNTTNTTDQALSIEEARKVLSSSNVDPKYAAFGLSTRLVSSVYSQDKPIALFLNPVASKDSSRSLSEEDLVSLILNLESASAISVRFHLLALTRQLFCILRHGYFNSIAPVSVAKSIQDIQSPLRKAAFTGLLYVLEKSYRAPGSERNNSLLKTFVEVVFDANVVPGQQDGQANIESPYENSPSSSLFQVIVLQWTTLLLNPSSEKEKRVSLVHSEVLLDILVKCLGTNGQVFPQKISEKNEKLVVNLVSSLIAEIHKTNSYGLIIRKELNRNLALFFRKLFCILQVQTVQRLTELYFQSCNNTSTTAEVLMNMAFPFLRIMVDFEYFVEVNEYSNNWLSKLIFETLMRVITFHSEEQIRREALTVLRRMFVSLSYHPSYQSNQEERIALMFLPMLDNVLALTDAPGGLLSQHNSISSSRQSSCRELLVCVAYILRNSSAKYLQSYWREGSECWKSLLLLKDNNESSKRSKYLTLGGKSRRKRRSSRTIKTSNNTPSSLLALRGIMEERKNKLLQKGRTGEMSEKASPEVIVEEESDNSQKCSEESQLERVLKFIHVLAQLIEHFKLPANNDNQKLLEMLSPDNKSNQNSGTAAASNKLSLLEIEAYVKQQRHSSASRADRRRSTAVSSVADATTRAHSNRSSLCSNQSLKRPDSSASILHHHHLAEEEIEKDDDDDAASETSSVVLHRTSTTSDGAAAGNNNNNTIGSTTSNTINNRSLPRDWKKQQGVDSVVVDQEVLENARVLSDTVVRTVLGSIGALIDELHQVFKAPSLKFIYTERNTQAARSEEEVSAVYEVLDACMGVCYSILVLPSIEDSTLTTLYELLSSFVTRFSPTLFASSNYRIMHDEKWCRQILLHASKGHKHALPFVAQLLEANFNQIGSCTDVTKSLYSVFRSVVSSTNTSTLHLKTAMLQLKADSTYNQRRGRVFKSRLDSTIECLLNMEKCLSLKQSVLLKDDAAVVPPHFEELEDLYMKVIDSIDPNSLPVERLCWVEDLCDLHKHRNNFVEAAECKLLSVETLKSAPKPGSILAAQAPGLITKALTKAHTLYTKGGLLNSAFIVLESLLSYQRQEADFESIIHSTVGLLTSLATELQSTRTNVPKGSYFKVLIRTGSAIKSESTSSSSWIYRRPPYTRLGDFAEELSSVIKASYSLCTSTHVVPENKTEKADAILRECESAIVIHVTSVERSLKDQADCCCFTYSTPFSLNKASSYGKTNEQFKRVVRLWVPRSFPTTTRRQVVTRVEEVVRCPIENSIDDVRRRSSLLQRQVDLHHKGQSDSKNLTHVLKGSVNTSVHGGVPELVSMFLEKDVKILGHDAIAMKEHLANTYRSELKRCLFEFMTVCLQVLSISREVYRNTINHSEEEQNNATLSPLQIEFEKSFVQMINLITTSLEDSDNENDWSTLLEESQAKLLV